MDYRNVKFDAVITCRTIPQVEQAIHKEARSTGLTPSQLVRQLVVAGLKQRGIDPDAV
jgi:hypothetical protein